MIVLQANVILRLYYCGTILSYKPKTGFPQRKFAFKAFEKADRYFGVQRTRILLPD